MPDDQGNLDSEKFTLTREELWGLVFTAAGAATAPLLIDNPIYIFPSERVGAAVSEYLEREGFGPPPHGYSVRPSEGAGRTDDFDVNGPMTEESAQSLAQQLRRPVRFRRLPGSEPYRVIPK